MAGIKPKKQPCATKSKIILVANVVGVVLEDGNPLVVDKMVEMDVCRTSASSNACDLSSCNPLVEVSGSHHKSLENQVNPLCIDETRDRQSKAELEQSFQELGWSIKKAKNKKGRK